MPKGDDTLPPLPRSPRVPGLQPKKPKSEPSPERQAAFSRGISAESIAAAWLIGKGYRILARRFRCAAGEIDIVAGRRQTVAIRLWSEQALSDFQRHVAAFTVPIPAGVLAMQTYA